MTESPNVIATRILDALAEAAEFCDPSLNWYGYVTLEDVRALAELAAPDRLGYRNERPFHEAPPTALVAHCVLGQCMWHQAWDTPAEVWDAERGHLDSQHPETISFASYDGQKVWP